MWLLKDSPALLTDLYELTMAQVYWQKGQNDTASFEVTIRWLPESWGFFVMAGLAELEEYLGRFAFSGDDIDYLKATGKFSDDFLQYLRDLKVETSVRALPEGTVFFAKEPIVEVTGPLIAAQMIESYVLNIWAFRSSPLRWQQDSLSPQRAGRWSISALEGRRVLSPQFGPRGRR